mgnify:CR=1 FL=1
MPLRERRLVQAIQLVRLERLALRFQFPLVLPWIRLVISNNTSSFVGSVAVDVRGYAGRPVTKAAKPELENRETADSKFTHISVNSPLERHASVHKTPRVLACKIRAKHCTGFKS